MGLYSLLSLRLGLGISEAPCFPANSRIVAIWFPQRIFEIEAFGDKGGLMWQQQKSQLLAFVRPGKPTKIFHRGVDDLDDSVGASIRTPRPHPEGFREAFANIYLDFGKAVAAHLKCSNPGLPLFPDAAYGLKSLQFIEACMRSNDHRSWIDIEG
jgi:predicted dehydrogenase